MIKKIKAKIQIIKAANPFLNQNHSPEAKAAKTADKKLKIFKKNLDNNPYLIL
jgi:hypothetical protein